MSAPLPARRLSDDDRYWLTRFPTDCTEAVTRKSRGDEWTEPCGKLAVAARFDPEEGSAYPVCTRHARGDGMVSLADLLEVANLWAAEDCDHGANYLDGDNWRCLTCPHVWLFETDPDGVGIPRLTMHGKRPAKTTQPTTETGDPA